MLYNVYMHAYMLKATGQDLYATNNANLKKWETLLDIDMLNRRIQVIGAILLIVFYWLFLYNSE